MIKAISGEEKISKDDITCAYYISPRGKDVYFDATCVDSYPCRGYCKQTQHLIGLTPGTAYDLKVVAHKEYGYQVYQFTTGTQ